MAKRSRSLRKIPLFVQTRLGSVGNQLVVAVVKRVALDDVKAGLYTHAGLSWAGGQITSTGATVPPLEVGRYARLNRSGQEIIRRDLPKVEKKIVFVNPRLFGIPGNRCTITQFREVFKREVLPARQLALRTEVLLANEQECIVTFSVDKVFSPILPDIDRELLFALNVLQESVGGVNIFSANATTQDFLGSIHVHWEILPAGERDNNIRLILAGFRPRTEQEREELEKRANERYDFFESLHPKHIIRGTGGLNGYMGALIQDEVVVFEHLTPGNGIYLLFADWATQSQRTKSDLLSNAQEGRDYVRITHTGDWQLRVREAIAERIQ